MKMPKHVLLCSWSTINLALALHSMFLLENGTALAAKILGRPAMHPTPSSPPIPWLHSFSLFFQYQNKLERALLFLNLGRNDYKYGFLNGKYIEPFEEYTPVIVTNIGSMHVIRNQERGHLQYISPWHAPIGVPSRLRFFTSQH